MSEEELEDAVQHAFLCAAENEDRFCAACGVDGDDGIRWLVMVGWRFLRGERRRISVRRGEVLPRDDAFPDLWPTATALIEHRHELARAESLLDQAAALHGAHWEPQLRQALVVRIVEEETDANAARRCGVPREYVNRARRWMVAQLTTA